MYNQNFVQLFGIEPRALDGKISQKHCNLAASIQSVAELIITKTARHLKASTAADNLCLAGGVSLNCVANGVLLREEIFKNIWIQPAAGDAGGALGAALSFYYGFKDKHRIVNSVDSMLGSLLGEDFSDDQIEKILDESKLRYKRLDGSSLISIATESLKKGKVIGWYQGRSEFGPRALGNRSILARADSVEMQTRVNLKIKFRESFRPFAPIVLQECAAEYFDLHQESPYMLLVAQAKNYSPTGKDEIDFDDLVSFLKKKRSPFPAITHIDGSARIQTVDSQRFPTLYALLQSCHRSFGAPLLLNTSFNVRGEPIVNSPLEALRCFMTTDMDEVFLGSFHLKKEEQKENQLQWVSQHAID